MKQNTKISQRNKKGFEGCKCQKRDLNASGNEFEVPKEQSVADEQIIDQSLDVASSISINCQQEAGNSSNKSKQSSSYELELQNVSIEQISNIQNITNFSPIATSKHMHSINQMSTIMESYQQPLTPESPTTTMLTSHRLRQIPTDARPSCKQIILDIKQLIQDSPNTIKNQLLAKLLSNIEQNENAYQKYVLTLIIHNLSNYPEDYILEKYLNYNHNNMSDFIERLQKNLYWQKCSQSDEDDVQTLIRESIGFTFLNRAVSDQFIYDSDWQHQLFDTINKTALVAPHYKYNNTFILSRNTQSKMIKEGFDVDSETTNEYDALFCLHNEQCIDKPKVSFKNLVVYGLGGIKQIQLNNTQQLVSLSLSWCSVQAKMNLPNVQTISLFNVKQFDPKTFSTASKLQNVYINTVTNNNVQYIGDEIIKGLSTSSDLTHLYIFGCDMRRKAVFDFPIHNLKTLAIYSPRSELQKVVIKMDKAKPESLEMIHLNYCDSVKDSVQLEIKGKCPDNLIYVQADGSKMWNK